MPILFCKSKFFIFYLFFLLIPCLHISANEKLLTSSVLESLHVIEIGHPTLRQKAREISRDEILQPAFSKLVSDMRKIMHEAEGVGLAAPQVGLPLQLIVIEDSIDCQTHLTSEQLSKRKREIIDFHVIINPKLILDSKDTCIFYEGCLSVPGLVGPVKRYNSVTVECLNEKAEPMVIQATGWYTRILQHEIDHLNGTLYLDHVKIYELTTNDNYEIFWKTN